MSTKEISAYCINGAGVLCYTGLPTQHSDLTYDHHNGKAYGYEIKFGGKRRQYEVGGVTQFALWHGKPFRIFPL